MHSWKLLTKYSQSLNCYSFNILLHLFYGLSFLSSFFGINKKMNVWLHSQAFQIPVLTFISSFDTDEVNESFSIVLTLWSRLHASVNIRSFACGLNCINSYLDGENRCIWNKKIHDHFFRLPLHYYRGV